MFFVEVREPVARIILANPKRRNALSLQVMQELTAALRELGNNQNVGAIVIASEGSAFSAGHDLAEMVDRSAG
ncbi:MAG: enoyl-CoA hydratase/isomerase family protein, partial [bacterium]|nr:enoyl-CoA hydratase/isomerase family protein [bacterium]